jgi:dTDP-4-amino-4,6-dideoxygalactose transaminase
MNKIEFSPWPVFSQDEIDAVSSTLSSGRVNYWTGEECREFEHEFSNLIGVKYAVALSNGTIALEYSLRALGLKSGDEVIVPSRTFLASASAVMNVGAVPIFADVEISSGNLSSRTIKALITKKTKAIICVHFSGFPCDMDSILSLAKMHHLFVIEDCAQAHGAFYKGKSVGSIGDVGCWSFCQDKIISTGGEGGMITTNNQNLWKTIWSYKDHGKDYDLVSSSVSTLSNRFKWVHNTIGSNGRMTELQAAIGRAQLKKLSNWVSVRNKNATYLINGISQQIKVPDLVKFPTLCHGGCDVQMNNCSEKCIHAFYKLYLQINPIYISDDWTRDHVLDEINSQGVPCFQGGCSEIYLEKAFSSLRSGNSPRLANAKVLGETSLMLMVHPGITFCELDRTITVVSKALLKLAPK